MAHEALTGAEDVGALAGGRLSRIWTRSVGRNESDAWLTGVDACESVVGYDLMMGLRFHCPTLT